MLLKKELIPLHTGQVKRSSNRGKNLTMAIRGSWLVLSLLLVLALAAAAVEEGSPSPSAKDEGAPSPAADEAADAPSDDDGAPAPEPASEKAESIGSKIKAKGKTVLEGLRLSNIECKLTGKCPTPAPEADAA